MAKRYLEKFESADGGVSYVFPLGRYEYDPSQPLSSPIEPLAGAHGAFRHLGTGVSLVRPGSELVRFVFNGTASEQEAEIDEARFKCFSVGLGKLWTLDSDATRRWAWAEITEMPSMVVRYKSERILPMSISFTRISPFWYGESQQSDEITLDEDPETFQITVAGDLFVMDAVFVFDGTFTNPNLVNDTNGYEFSSTRDGSSTDHVLRVDAGRSAVEFSTDNGDTYADDFALFSRGASQAQFMRLEAGVNDFTYNDGGTPNAALTILYYPVYA